MHMRSLLILCGLWLLATSSLALGDAPRLVATIKPLHSLAAAVTEGVSEPYRLLPDGSSPHAYSLKPSDMRALQSADVLVWVGPELETFLQRPLESLPEDTRVIEALRLPGVKTYPLRDLHHHGHDHDHGGHGLDPHFWLDPTNAREVVSALETLLVGLDPENAQAYAANAERARTRLMALDLALAERLKGLRGTPYVVFHDAYQYFEKRYGLEHAAALAIDPSRTPGARRIQEVREVIRETGARCVFAEPQFRPAIVDTVIEGTSARHATLDPVGAEIEAGPGAYPELLQRLARDFEACLGES
jgi:zinc transport system substrate-binding protein